VKTNERAKNPIDTERREQEPGRKDKMDPRQPMPRQPEQGQPEHRQPQPRQQEPPDRRPGAPRERSDEDTIGRPVQLDDDAPMGDLDEPDPATKGEPQRERRAAR
jgi:hypothetical protein